MRSELSLSAAKLQFGSVDGRRSLSAHGRLGQKMALNAERARECPLLAHRDISLR